MADTKPHRQIRSVRVFSCHAPRVMSLTLLSNPRQKWPTKPTAPIPPAPSKGCLFLWGPNQAITLRYPFLFSPRIVTPERAESAYQRFILKKTVGPGPQPGRRAVSSRRVRDCLERAGCIFIFLTWGFDP